jgi:hypothetical protein
MLGYAVNPVFYVMHEREVLSPVKIGKDETWPSRFVQARCHTPRPLVVAAILKSAVGRVSAFDGAVRLGFEKDKIQTRAKEWFNLTPKEAVKRLMSLLPGFELVIAPEVQIKSEHQFYDDWRDCRARTLRYAWRIFVHEEAGTGRLKASYGALFDTHFLYCATYNWRPLRLVAGFESPEGRIGNRKVEAAWARLTEELRLGCQNQYEQVGWLSSSATLDKVSEFLRASGLVSFPLNRPKPLDAPLKDPAMSKKWVERGKVPPLEWVKT